MLKCNCCGNPINQSIDKEPPLIIRHSFGYYSKRDLEKINATLCTNCTENLTEYLISKCVINPVIDTIAI